MTTTKYEGGASSANACKDPDRQIVDDFERGAGFKSGDSSSKLSELPMASVDPHNVTFVLHHEDHTLGNALRHVLSQYPDVDFVGYTVPHPSEFLIHLRIQTTNSQRTSRQVLKQAFADLHATYDHLEQLFRQEAAKSGQTIQ
jgi:DNA-directed RNA polymerase I and III subunit RPAC2